MRRVGGDERRIAARSDRGQQCRGARRGRPREQRIVGQQRGEARHLGGEALGGGQQFGGALLGVARAGRPALCAREVGRARATAALDRAHPLERAVGALGVAGLGGDPDAHHVHVAGEVEGVFALEVQLGLGQPALRRAEAPGEELQITEADRRLGRRLMVVATDAIGEDPRQLDRQPGPVGAGFDRGEAVGGERHQARVVLDGDVRQVPAGERARLVPAPDVEQRDRQPRL